jgi:hypothetical protein
MSAALAKELRALRRELAKLRRDVEARDAAVAGRDGAVKRRVAAKMMGVGLTKLEALIRDGEVRTAVDRHLIPLAEVRRYCSPKTPRRAPKRYDRVPDAGDEARLVRESLRGAK